MHWATQLLKYETTKHGPDEKWILRTITHTRWREKLRRFVFFGASSIYMLRTGIHHWCNLPWCWCWCTDGCKNKPASRTYWSTVPRGKPRASNAEWILMNAFDLVSRPKFCLFAFYPQNTEGVTIYTTAVSRTETPAVVLAGRPIMGLTRTF